MHQKPYWPTCPLVPPETQMQIMVDSRTYYDPTGHEPRGKKASTPVAGHKLHKIAKNQARRWKRESRKAKWKSWEANFKSATSRGGWRNLTSLKGLSVNKAICEIQESTNFEGKCDNFRSILLLATEQPPNSTPDLSLSQKWTSLTTYNQSPKARSILP